MNRRINAENKLPLLNFDPRKKAYKIHKNSQNCMGVVYDHFVQISGFYGLETIGMVDSRASFYRKTEKCTERKINYKRRDTRIYILGSESICLLTTRYRC